MKWIESIWHGRINNVQFMARIGYVVVAILIFYLYLKYRYPLKVIDPSVLLQLKPTEMMGAIQDYGESISNIIKLYAYRYTWLGIWAFLYLLLGFLYIKRLQDINIPKWISAIPVLIMWGSFSIIATNLLKIYNAVTFDQAYIQQAIMFMMRQSERMADLLKLPQVLEAIVATKVPLYTFIGSLYFILISGMLLISRESVNRYGERQNPYTIQYLFVLFYAIFFGILTYYIIHYFILNDPYESVEQLLEYLSFLR